MDKADLDELVLGDMPHFIAVNYHRLLETQSPRERVELILHTYNLALRALTIGLVSQYLIRDREKVCDAYLNELLLQKFPHLTLDAWQQLFFASLRAYEGKRDLFFMPELYDFYWDTSTLPHRQRVEVERPFDRLTQVAMEIQGKQLLPKDEAGWKRLAEETMDLLQQILVSMAFIGRYDLIRVLNYDELSYDYELHKGLSISVGHQPRPKHTELSRGWFYLRAETEDFLLLHPLLVLWEEREPKASAMVPTDTGVYDRFVYERLWYLLATPGKMVVDDTSVKTFVTLLYDTIEEWKVKKQEAEKLTWWQLRDICEDITQRRMATVQQKYQRELYLQRDKTRQAFERFLRSEKRCFVLTGKSGVGKSNFLLALGEEFHKSRSDLCLLMYDGAHLKVEPSVTEVISQDFDDRLTLAGQRVQQVWREIARIEGIEERLVILCVDAINESPHAKELLRQLDELVQGPWPWLKVVFSSRPETWQTIKRGVKLAEALYYREEEAETLGVELEPFSYSERMDPFSRQELPEAYVKYQQAFNLQTKYETLPVELREILQEPLNLWLVAKTYAGREIPGTLKVTELVEQYVDVLLRSERLQGEDLRLLEKQLGPLILSEGYCSNAITVADIDAAGGGLYEAVYSEQILSDGRRMNQSFTNLLDADILVRQGEGREKKIAFRYERFYEYFAGRRILELLNEAQSDPYDFFLDMIRRTTETPFLWGAVKHSLIQDAKNRGCETIIRLCFTEQQRVKELMMSVLLDLGRDNRAQVEVVLRNLVPSEKKRNRLQRLQQLLGKSTVTTDTKSRNAKKVAIEVASSLNSGWVLVTAALQADPTIRTAAVRYSYHLWQHEPDAGFEILESLAQSATCDFIPDSAAFESVLGLSLMIFFDHPQDKPVLQKLQSIWRLIISKTLSIQESGSGWGNLLRGFIRDQVISAAIAVIFRLLGEMPQYTTVNSPDLEAFFRLGATEKSLYRNLTQYLNVQGTYSREQMMSDFLKVLEIRNLIVQGVAAFGLIAHATLTPLEYLPFLKILFEKAQKDPLPNPWLRTVPDVLVMLLHRDPMVDEVFDFFVQAAEVCQEYYTEHPRIPGLNHVYSAPGAMFTCYYTFYQYRRTGVVKTDWLETRIKKALSHNNIAFFEMLLKAEMPALGIELRTPRAALDALALFFNCHNAEINQMIQSFLARLRIHYPDEVDDFLEEQRASPEFRLQVQTSEPIETIGEILPQRAWYFFLGDVLGGSQTLRAKFIHAFAKLADCTDMQAWARYAITEIINVVYGEEVLRQTI